MNLSERIQTIRKQKGISQEELANEIGVSRQAVSKWESGQSQPDLDKVIALSEYFDVTTDYILKGVDETANTHTMASKILYIVSTFMMTIGLLCAIGSWYEKQTLQDIAGGMLIQAVGVAGYFIGTVISREKAVFFIKWLNIILAVFMPISMVVSFLLQRILSPYPTDVFAAAAFTFLYGTAVLITFFLLKRQEKKVVNVSLKSECDKG